MNWSEAVSLAKERKEEGFNFLYRQTYQKSYYVALKYMKQEDAAMDVLQDHILKHFAVWIICRMQTTSRAGFQG